MSMHAGALKCGLFTILIGTWLSGLDSAHAVPLTIGGGFHFRDIRSPNSVGARVGDRLVMGTFISPDDGTVATATQGSTTIALFDNPDSDTEFSTSVPYDPGLTGVWTINATNGPDTATTVTNAVGGVGPLPFVRNFRIVPNNLTPTLLWDLPVGSSEPFNGVSVGFFDDRSDFRLEFPGGGIFRSLDATATSFTFPDGALEEGVPYVFRVFLSNNEPVGQVNRATTFKNFTPILGSGGPELFLPTVDSNGVFRFDFDVLAGIPVVIDPFVAIGYEYKIGDGDPRFATITLPEVGDNLFEIAFLDSSSTLISEIVEANREYVFPTVGVDSFTVTGIETSAGLDPSDVTAFMSTLTFVSDGAFTGTMTPITEFVETAVPEPTTLILMVVGILALFLRQCRTEREQKRTEANL